MIILRIRMVTMRIIIDNHKINNINDNKNDTNNINNNLTTSWETVECMKHIISTKSEHCIKHQHI